VVFPVRDPELAARLRNEVLAAYLADTAKSRFLRHDGVYFHPTPSTDDTGTPMFKEFNVQEFLMQLAESKVTAADIPPQYIPPAFNIQSNVSNEAPAEEGPATRPITRATKSATRTTASRKKSTS
jgi:hypothetical protein